MRPAESLAEFYATRLFLFERLCENSDLSQEPIDKTEVFDRLCNLNSRPTVMIIGEAPGAKEVELGQPFVGAAGKNLSLLIELSGIDRKKILITNGFPFRTFKHGAKGVINRAPTKEELAVGAKLLEAEIAIARPEMVLLLGLSALKAASFLDSGSNAKELRNIPRHSFSKLFFSFLSEPLTIGVGYHPSPLVFNQPQKREQLKNFFLRLHEK